MIWSTDEYYYKCDQILENTHMDAIRITKFGELLLRVESYFLGIQGIENDLKPSRIIYIFIIKLLIWSLNILGVKSAHMGDFHN